MPAAELVHAKGQTNENLYIYIEILYDDALDGTYSASISSKTGYGYMIINSTW